MSTKKFIETLEKRKTGMVTLSDKSVLSRVNEFVSTGCPPLDLIIGGGIPVGRPIEIYGDTSTGKSLLAAHILAETQAVGGIAVLFDTETATDEGVMEAVGIDNDALIYAVPETIEEVYSELINVISIKREVDPKALLTVVWDSVASTYSEEEFDNVTKKGLGKGYPVHAMLISQMCRLIRAEIPKQRMAFVFINQAKTKLGVMFGDDVTTFGGKAIGFHSSVRLEMKHVRKYKGSKDGPIRGIVVRVIVAKNKIAPPFGQCEFPIIFGIGIDEPGSVFEWLRKRKLIKSAGGFWMFGDDEEDKFRKAEFADIYWDNKDIILGIMDDEYHHRWE